METGLLVLFTMGSIPLLVKFVAEVLEKIGKPIDRTTGNSIQPAISHAIDHRASRGVAQG